MSDTPRTDTLCEAAGDQDDTTAYYAMVEHARQLERENQQLQLRVEQAENELKKTPFTQIREQQVKLHEREEQNELLSKQIAEKDEALNVALQNYRDLLSFAHSKGVVDPVGRMTINKIKKALSTTGSDYIHKDDLEKERQLRKRANEDSCADDTAIRDLARNVLDPLLIDGDSNGVPTLVEVVEQMKTKLKHDLANANASVVSQGDSNGRRINHLEQELSQFKEKCKVIVDALQRFLGDGEIEEEIKQARQAILLAKKLGLL